MFTLRGTTSLRIADNALSLALTGIPVPVYSPAISSAILPGRRRSCDPAAALSLWPTFSASSYMNDCFRY